MQRNGFKWPRRHCQRYLEYSTSKHWKLSTLRLFSQLQTRKFRLSKIPATQACRPSEMLFLTQNALWVLCKITVSVIREVRSGLKSMPCTWLILTLLEQRHGDFSHKNHTLCTHYMTDHGIKACVIWLQYTWLKVHDTHLKHSSMTKQVWWVHWSEHSSPHLLVI